MAVDGAALREALARTGQDHGPGLFGLITEGGRVVFEGSVGVADLRRPRPIEARDRFRVGSVTKVYLATVVLQLVAEGAVSLADPVQRWLPDAVPDGAAITVEMLLRMRSGLPDYVDAVFGDPRDLRALDRYWSPEQLVAAALTSPDRLAPDTGFRYSNTDYVLLGMIVEKATGQRVEAQLWQRIVKPLGLHDTTFPTVDPYLRGPHATGYLRDGATSPYVECTTISPSESWTAGAIVATAGDLTAFLDGLLGGTLLAADDLARMIDCEEVVDEHRSRGLGIVRYDFGNGPVAYGHPGGMPGYSTVAMRTTAGRCIVLWQNGLDAHDPLTTDAPFVQAALSA
ncbi:serine hydrolase domain-containing protein [Planosporangium sp. 12N6]|uniref:serine hydrolase domain-containing protein n=1 Tax=Planosporangium spinosum TaxID=3402278 RepID=UPI003CE71C87